MKPLEVSVILPVFNEKGNLAPLLAEVRQTLSLPFKGAFEILAIDDGSTDGSDLELRKLIPQFPEMKLLSFRKNAGQSAAFDAGFRYATGKVIVTMDADLQNDPRDILPLIEKLNEGFDVVSGWRVKRQDGLFLRRFPSIFSNFLIRQVTKTKVHDLGCSLKVYRAEVLNDLRLYGEMHRFICPLLESMGARVAELKVNHRPRTYGSSKYGLARTFKVLLDLLHVWFLQNYHTKPIYVFGGLGFCFSTAGILIGMYSLFERLEYGVRIHRNPLFVIAVMLLIIGVQMISVGLIAELLIRTYFESRGKTPYAIKSKVGFESQPVDWKAFAEMEIASSPSKTKLNSQ